MKGQKHLFLQTKYSNLRKKPFDANDVKPLKASLVSLFSFSKWAVNICVLNYAYFLRVNLPTQHGSLSHIISFLELFYLNFMTL